MTIGPRWDTYVPISGAALEHSLATAMESLPVGAPRRASQTVQTEDLFTNRLLLSDPVTEVCLRFSFRVLQHSLISSASILLNCDRLPCFCLLCIYRSTCQCCPAYVLRDAPETTLYQMKIIRDKRPRSCAGCVPGFSHSCMVMI